MYCPKCRAVLWELANEYEIFEYLCVPCNKVWGFVDENADYYLEG